MINDKENEIFEGQPVTDLVDFSTILDNSVLQETLEPEPVPHQVLINFLQIKISWNLTFCILLLLKTRNEI